jgi:hypothetical protein
MKHAFKFCIAVLLLWTANSASTWADDSPVAGIWKAKLHRQPCVRLTVHNDEGRLSGTIIFYLLVRENGSWQVKGHDEVELIDPHLENNVLTFDVRRAAKPGDETTSQQRMTFHIELTGKNQGIWKNAIEGQDLLLTWFAK